VLASQVLGSALLKGDGCKTNPAGPCLEGSVSQLEGEEAAASGCPLQASQWESSHSNLSSSLDPPLCPPLEGRQADASGKAPHKDLHGSSWSTSPPSAFLQTRRNCSVAAPPSTPPQEEARPFSCNCPPQASSPWGAQLSHDNALRAPSPRKVLPMRGLFCEQQDSPRNGRGQGQKQPVAERLSEPEPPTMARRVSSSGGDGPPASHGLRRRVGGFVGGLCRRGKGVVGIAAGLAIILPLLLPKLAPLHVRAAR